MAAWVAHCRECGRVVDAIDGDEFASTVQPCGHTSGWYSELVPDPPVDYVEPAPVVTP